MTDEMLTGAKLAHAGGQFGLHDVLQSGVQGENHVESVARLDVLIAVIHQFALAFVHLGVPPAADAVELGVVFQFDAVHAGLFFALAADIANDMRGQALARINALLVIGGENRLGAQRAVKRLFGAFEPGFIHAEGKGGHGLADFFPGFQGGLVFERRRIGRGWFCRRPRSGAGPGAPANNPRWFAATGPARGPPRRVATGPDWCRSAGTDRRRSVLAGMLVASGLPRMSRIWPRMGSRAMVRTVLLAARPSNSSCRTTCKLTNCPASSANAASNPKARHVIFRYCQTTLMLVNQPSARAVRFLQPNKRERRPNQLLRSRGTPCARRCSAGDGGRFTGVSARRMTCAWAGGPRPRFIFLTCLSKASGRHKMAS